MANTEDLRPRREELLNELRQIDRDLADDLLRAVTAYVEAESRLVSIDESVGHGVSTDRFDRLARLEVVRVTLERGLGRGAGAHAM
jgi:hypothetical protein